MQADKVSIIIPVYNVEAYLNKCVESILQQSYSNLEVLLIDDGSTDRSGEFCDQWAGQDVRIKVFHKENGGISDARNVGIDASTGDYLLFVDSDDTITPDMVQKLYDALRTANADISICNFLHVFEDGTPIPEFQDDRPVRDEIISGFEVIQKMHNAPDGERWLGWCYSMAWNKLYKRSLFSTLRFPKGKYCEDVFVAHRIFGKCQTVACISDVCYYYMRHSSSITFDRSRQVHLNDAEGYLDRAIFCHDQGMQRAAAHAYWYSAILLSKACPKQEDPASLRNEFEETMRLFRQNHCCRKQCTKKEALQVDLITFSPGFYRFISQNPIRKKIQRAIWKLRK